MKKFIIIGIIVMAIIAFITGYMIGGGTFDEIITEQTVVTFEEVKTTAVEYPVYKDGKLYYVREELSQQ